MRQIGNGQEIHVYIIPEVAELMIREISNMKIPHEIKKKTSRPSIKEKDSEDDILLPRKNLQNEQPKEVLWKIVAWLLINSMRSEKVQFSMLVRMRLNRCLVRS